MSEETTNTIQQNNRKKVIAIIAATAVILIVLAVGIGIYNTPTNRLQRQLDLGNKYLEEQDYEQAAIAFEEAIAIDDRCMEAYMGGIEAYLGAGNVDGAKDFYDRTLTMISGLDTDFANTNMDSIVEIYLVADAVYGDEWEKILQVLENGYTFTGEDSRIKDKLIENYLQIGKEDTQNGSYEEALTVYDRLLELDNTNTETINDLCDCLNKYINILMEAGKYDEIRALAEKYGDVATYVDFQGIMAQIAEIERIEVENRVFMQKVYYLMMMQDYDEGLCELYGSEEADAFAESMGNDSYIYIPDSNGSLNGVGAGVYKYKDDEEETAYYFYYGDYVNGERKGTGTEFLELDYGYSVFTGTWNNDAPNGEGTVILVGGHSYNNDTRYDTVASGTLIDGLWDGQVNYIATDSKGEFDLSFSAVNGVPTENKTEEFLSEFPGVELEVGTYIYAFDSHSKTTWWARIEEEKLIGIAGFTE